MAYDNNSTHLTQLIGLELKSNKIKTPFFCYF
jgi:hypothetical protein